MNMPIKKIWSLLFILTIQLNGMDINKEYIDSVVKHIFKSNGSSSVLYTALLDTKNPEHTIRWQLHKNSETNEISCKVIHTTFIGGLNLDMAPEDLPQEYFALIEEKYKQQKSK